MKRNATTLKALAVLVVGAACLAVSGTMADDSKSKKGGLFGLFKKKEDRQRDHAPPRPNVPAEAAGASVIASGGSSRVSDGVNRYPHIQGYETKFSKGQLQIEVLIDRIYEEFEQKIQGFDGDVLGRSTVGDLEDLPANAISDWAGRASGSIWAGDRQIPQSIGHIYLRALASSNQIKVFSDDPLIREAAIQAADGAFDWNIFANASYGHTDDPIGSELTTGATDGRFVEDRGDASFGLRTRTALGTEVVLRNDFSMLSSNSQFLIPDNQGGGEFTLSFTQPLLKGAGIHYNTAPLKVAKLDARSASAEFVGRVQTHLLEVNRSYWALYYARSSFLLRKANFAQAEKILERIEDRGQLDTDSGELARSFALVQRRKASLIRSEMAIKNAEERLRALINDPQFGIGTGGELVPTTLPIITRPIGGLKEVAREALYNRPEVDQGFAQMRAAAVRKDVFSNELLPALNLVAEGGVAGLASGNRAHTAYGDAWEKGRPSWLVGLEFEMPLGNNTAKANARRAEIELRQQANQLRTVIDNVLLEAIISFREVSTAYRDMQAKYQSFLASQQELKKLEERMELAGADAEGQTTSYYLQLILDAQERLEVAQDALLDSVVIYNVSFASLERAKGTFLRYQGVSIDRLQETAETHPTKEIDKLLLRGASSKSSKNYHK